MTVLKYPAKAFDTTEKFKYPTKTSQGTLDHSLGDSVCLCSFCLVRFLSVHDNALKFNFLSGRKKKTTFL